MNRIQVRTKIWLEVDGEPLLGAGRVRLLRAIDEGGSINAAAVLLNISYRKVWAQLRQMEAHAPFPLVERTKGGRGGGSTRLTEETRILLARYAQLCESLDELVADKFTGGLS